MMHSRRLYSVIYIVVVVIGAILISSVGWKSFWSAMRLPTLSPSFADMRTVQGGLISIQSGHNPQLVNPGDPWGRTMNYPLVWLDIARFMKLNDEAHYLIFCSVMVVSVALTNVYLLHTWPSALLLCSFLSSATLLAMERGNNDLLVYLLLIVFGYSGRSLMNAALIVAVVVKVYPMFAVHQVLAKGDYKRLLVLLAGIFIAILFLYSELPAIQSGNIAVGTLSYGISSIKTLLNMIMRSMQEAKLSSCAALIGLALALVACVRFSSCLLEPFRADVTSCGTISDLFMIGAAIFVYTFVIAANWDYRLICLSLCIPYLSMPRHGWQGKAFCVAILLAMNVTWLRAIWGPLAYLSLLSKLFLFVSLCMIITRPVIDNGVKCLRPLSGHWHRLRSSRRTRPAGIEPTLTPCPK